MRVKYWTLNVPIRVDGWGDKSSFTADQGVVDFIEVLDNGLVIVTRKDGAPSLVLHGREHGILTEEAEAEFRATRALTGGSKKAGAPSNKPTTAAGEAAKQLSQGAAQAGVVR